MFPIALAANAAMAGLGGLLGKFGQPQLDLRTYLQGIGNMDFLFGKYGKEEGQYGQTLGDMTSYFAGGGSASEANRQKQMGQATSQINWMMPSMREQQQQAMARSGMGMGPSTARYRQELNTGIAEAWQRSQAINQVNQRFDEMLDKNKAIAASLSSQQVGQIRNLMTSLATTKADLGLKEAGMKAEHAKSGFNLGSMGGAIAGGALGNIFGKGAGSLSGLFGGGGGGAAAAGGGLANLFSGSLAQPALLAGMTGLPGMGGMFGVSDALQGMFGGQLGGNLEDILKNFNGAPPDWMKFFEGMGTPQ